MQNSMSQWVPLCPSMVGKDAPLLQDVDVAPCRDPVQSASVSVLLFSALCLAGTGGDIPVDRFATMYGTGSFAIRVVAPAVEAVAVEAVHLETIKNALRLSVAEMAQLFGVSRQTIYNWLNGKAIDAGHAQRLHAIADAVEPHLKLLESQPGRIANRAIEGRHSLFHVLKSGSDPMQAMQRLASILERESAQRARLSHRLQGHAGHRGTADIDALG